MAKRKHALLYEGKVCVGVRHKKRPYTLRICHWRQAARIIEANHYSKRPTPLASVVGNFLCEYPDSENGAIQLSLGQNPHIHDGNATVEFGRMWLPDTMPKYSESTFIAMLHFYLRQQTAYNFIQSWSDTGEGNPGTIYKASGYELVKQTASGGFYILPDGRKVHSVSLLRWIKSLLKQRIPSRDIKGSSGLAMARRVFGDVKEYNAPQRLYQYDLRGSSNGKAVGDQSANAGSNPAPRPKNPLGNHYAPE